MKVHISIIKSFTLFLLINLISFSAFAQKKIDDVVYLKNGSIIRGTITEFNPEQSVKIETVGGSLFVFEMTEVETITREATQNKRARTGSNPKIKDKGYFNETEFNLLFSNDGGVTAGYGIQTVNGYQVNRHVRIGGGIGLDHYSRYDHTFSGLLGRVSGDVLKFWITPIYYVDAGYLFSWDIKNVDPNTTSNKGKGGLMISTGVGVKFYTRSRVGFLMSVGYKIQRSSRDYMYTWDDETHYRENREYRRFVLKAGISF